MEYQIHVKESLEQRWSPWFEGLTLTSTENGCTLISGWLRDQAALHGVLAKIRDLNLTLISVNPLPSRKS
jgi:hypothetical protein